MTTDIALREKREELKHRLAAGEYRTLIDVLPDGISRIVQKLTRTSRPISPGYGSIILWLVIQLTGFGMAILVGEASNAMRQLATISAGFLPLTMLVSYFVIASMFVSNIYVHRVFTTFHDSVLNAAESIATVDDFERWLTAVCNRRAHLMVSIVVGLLSGTYMVSLLGAAIGSFVALGFILNTLLVSICSSASLYLLIHMVQLSARVSRYHLKLYAADPSSSEVIGRLAGVLSSFVYLVAIYATLLTLAAALSGFPLQVNVVVLALSSLLWMPIIAMFVLNQSSLSSVVRRAKWKTLNEIQARVEQLHTADSLGEKDTMDAINRLMDYHDRIKGTRSSAFDFRAVLSLINSLLLPFLALLLANLDKVLALFQ